MYLKNKEKRKGLSPEGLIYERHGGGELDTTGARMNRGESEST